MPRSSPRPTPACPSKASTRRFRGSAIPRWVDCLSLGVMRAERIRHAFAFAPDFDEQGFPPPPDPASG